MVDSAFPVDAARRAIHCTAEQRVRLSGVATAPYKPGRPSAPADSFSERNPQSCKPYAGVSEFDAWRTENKRIAVQLLEEHGWLEVARESPNLLLYRNSKSAPVETAIPKQVGPGANLTTDVRYVP